MSVPVHTLKKEQKIWYARFVIGAILADDEISPSEVDFMKQVIAIVDSPNDKKELMQLISVKEQPPLTPPKGISKEVLAAIFIELILIMISDLDFADKEKVYLKDVSQLFNFSDTYFTELMKWGEDGLEWKSSQRYLIAEDGEAASFNVPLNKLNPVQKKWYAYVLIATIMLDGLVEDTELQFLKAAMTLLDSKKDQQQVLGYVRNKMAPPLAEPPNIPNEVLLLIFFEVILIVSADESLSYKEQSHLKTISDLCGFSNDLLDRAVDWCNKGISWKQTKNPLIARCKFKSTSTSLQGQGPLEAHPENNSILFRDLECFVCNSTSKIKGYQLKPHSQEPNRNIFGITTYLESLGDHDYIDFNRIKIFICPKCFFASSEKNLFKKNKGEAPPSILASKKFKDLWLKGVNQRKSMMTKCTKEMGTIKRSIATVEKTYQLAVKTAQTLADKANDQTYGWQAVTLKLTLAEVMMSNGDGTKGDEYLEEARMAADELFRNASNNLVAIKSARLLFYIALYNNDVRTAGPFVDYIRSLHHEGSGSLKANETAVLRKVFGETQNALKNRPDYKKEDLMGYHLDV